MGIQHLPYTESICLKPYWSVRRSVAVGRYRPLCSEQSRDWIVLNREGHVDWGCWEYLDLKWQIKLDVPRNLHVTCILRQADVGVMKLIKVRCARHVECVKDTRNAYKSLVGNPYWKIRLVRRRRNLEDKLKLTRCESLEWSCLAECSDQWWIVVNTVMDLCFR